MSIYRTASGRNIRLDTLTTEERSVADYLIKTATDALQNLTRTKLRHFAPDFEYEAIPEIRTLYEKITVETIKQSAVIFIFDDLMTRFKIALELPLEEDQVPIDPLQPKDWTGRPEHQTHVFHLGQKDDDINPEIILSPVQVVDEQGGGYRENLEELHANEKRTFIGSVETFDPDSSEFVASLLHKYGKEMENLFVSVFRLGYTDGRWGNILSEEKIIHPQKEEELMELPSMKKFRKNIGEGFLNIVFLIYGFARNFGEAHMKRHSS